MELQLQTKAQAFVLLDSFENDLRKNLRDYVLDHQAPEDVLGASYQDVVSRMSAEDSTQVADVSQYLYLRQVFDLLLSNKNAIPRDLGDELIANTGSLDQLVALRNRVMHGRPLHVNDLESVAGIISRFKSRFFPSSKTTRERLAIEPLWDPPYAPQPISSERVLHNLPLADFDETGLVGRTKESEALRQLLERRRDKILTITGEGGIGKTALALQIAYAVVDDIKSPFDCVLWVSLKHEMLTADGVRSLSGAIKDIAGASLEMGKVFDRSFSGSLSELAEYLEGLDTLIIIDNLESAQGSEVLDLYDALPETTSFLFTSRVGLGQVERRYPLAGLDPKSAALLFRKFSSRRRVSTLAALPPASVESTLEALRYSPLAIRWYVLSVEAGSDPSDALRNQGELLRFCVDNVYEALKPNARLLLVILRSLDRPISFDELVVLAELPIDELRASSQALSRGSLVVRQAPSSEGDSERLQISATARAYLPRVDYESSMLRGVADREAAYLSDRQLQEIEAQSRRLDANMIHLRNAQDQPTAHLLRLALRFAKSSEYLKSEAQIEKARSLNPEFFEVDRVAAFIYATRRDLYRADLAYRGALSLAQTAEEKAIVLFFYAGFAARMQFELTTAIRYAQQAHETLHYHDTALLLGNIHVWLHQFAEGQELLEFALEAQSSKMKRIATTAIVESWRRWADFSMENQNPNEAFNQAGAGVTVGMQFLRSGNQDQKLAKSVVGSMRTALTALERSSDRMALDTDRLGTDLGQVAEWISLFRTVDYWNAFYDTLLRVANKLQPEDAVSKASVLMSKAYATGARLESNATGDTAEAIVMRGVIKAVKDNFGFIKHPRYPADVFFHKGSIASGSWEEFEENCQVVFELELEPTGRFRANNVRLEAPPA